MYLQVQKQDSYMYMYHHKSYVHCTGEKGKLLKLFESVHVAKFKINVNLERMSDSKITISMDT